MRILHHLNFWASVVFIAIIFFLFFTLKFQIGKRLFLKFRIYFTKIIGRNVCDLMLFCQICENLYPQIIWFSNILLIQFSQQFFRLQKIVLASIIFFHETLSSKFSSLLISWTFFGDDIIYLTIHKCLFLQKLAPGTPLARVISLRFANFSASKSLFQESFYLYDTGF